MALTLSWETVLDVLRMRREVSEQQGMTVWKGEKRPTLKAAFAPRHTGERALSEVRFRIFVPSSPDLAAVRAPGLCVSRRMNE